MKRPKDIIRIYDNRKTKNETLDCITVVLNYIDGPNGENACLATSYNGLAFSQFSYCDNGPHLGRPVSWESLSTELKQHIKGRLENE